MGGEVRFLKDTMNPIVILCVLLTSALSAVADTAPIKLTLGEIAFSSNRRHFSSNRATFTPSSIRPNPRASGIHAS